MRGCCMRYTKDDVQYNTTGYLLRTTASNSNTSRRNGSFDVRLVHAYLTGSRKLRTLPAIPAFFFLPSPLLCPSLAL